MCQPTCEHSLVPLLTIVVVRYGQKLLSRHFYWEGKYKAPNNVLLVVQQLSGESKAEFFERARGRCNKKGFRDVHGVHRG